MSKKSFKLLSLVLIAGLALNGISATAQEGDTLNLLYWQAISTTLNPYLSGGTKDLHAASLLC